MRNNEQKFQDDKKAMENRKTEKMILYWEIYMREIISPSSYAAFNYHGERKLIESK